MDLSNNSKYELPCRGELTINTYDINGRLLHVYETPNTIVYGARTLMAKLLVGDDTTNKKISKLAVGVDATPPTRNDTQLRSKVGGFVPIAPSAITYPAVGQVELRALLAHDQAVGSTLTEVGLFTEDETTMFARQVHGDHVKTNALQMEYLWRIIFT